MQTKFLTTFTYPIKESLYSLKTLSKLHLTKALKKLFLELKNQNENFNNQIIGIILKLSFSDGSIKSISTYRKGSVKSFSKFSILFKHLLNLRAGDTSGDSDFSGNTLNITAIIFSYHIYSENYDSSLLDQDTLLDGKSYIESSSDNLKYKEDLNIKYMNPLKLFKLPLTFAGSGLFLDQTLKLNKSVSDKHSDDPLIKYRIYLNYISNYEVELKLTIIEDPSIVIFKMKDKLITIPQLEQKDLLIERTILSRSNEIYLIDGLTNEIVLVKKFNSNKVNGF
uniref:Uncharacterized protein n=1 Tax=Amanita bisporigera TaxID=87325 RepID=A0A5Q0N2N4_AMABI|nr:hypothetical protein [Amanita bisporigera]QFZ98560.1 hypothetical protein [Amanita bisporigera]